MLLEIQDLPYTLFSFLLQEGATLSAEVGASSSRMNVGVQNHLFDANLHLPRVWSICLRFEIVVLTQNYLGLHFTFS